MKVLVTDGLNRAALGVVRTLGKKNISVDVMGFKYSHSFFSKYCKRSFVCPNPKNEEEFISFLMNIIKKNEYDLLMPVGHLSTMLVAKYRVQLEPFINLEVADYKDILVALSKKKTYMLADKLRVPYPKSLYPKNFEEVNILSEKIECPVVIKALSEMGTNVVDYVWNRKEFLTKYNRMCKSYGFTDGNLPLIQEFVEGDGEINVAAIYQKGRCKQIFMFRQIRSVPLRGGSGSCSESFYDDEAKKNTIKLLDALNWHGVALVDFKRDKNKGELNLMEINPKFWTSLDFALVYGVDFPYYLCEMAMGKELEYSEHYNRNLRFHFPLSLELRHVVKNPRAFPNIIADTLNPKVKSNVWFGDLKPNLMEFLTTLVDISPLKGYATRKVTEQQND